MDHIIEDGAVKDLLTKLKKVMKMNKQVVLNNKVSQGQKTRAFAYALYSPAFAPRFTAWGGAKS